MQAPDTPMAHLMSLGSVSAVANRVSSTTLSMLRSPEENASAMRGRPSRAWAALIHRSAFHQEMP
jgi:hypothetical protein